jgi:hypothetical protein
LRSRSQSSVVAVATRWREFVRGYHDAVREAEGKILTADDGVIFLIRGKGVDVSDTVIRKAMRRRVLEMRRRMRRRGAAT